MAIKNKEDIIKRLNEANCLIKDEWDKDSDNTRAAGCYKALNAICAALNNDAKDGDDNGDDNEYYIFSRLIEAISWLSDYYGITLEDALRLGGVQYFSKL